MTAGADLELAVLGRTAVRVAGAEAPLRQRERQLLTALAVDHPRPVPPAALVHRLWPLAAPGSAKASVKNHVARLRRALGDDAIVTDQAGYRLGHRWTLDAERFAADVDAARAAAAAGDHERAVRGLEGALVLVRGGFAGDLDDDDLDAARSRWTETVDAVREALVGSLVEIGDHARAVSEARALAEADPFRELRWVLLATALYRQGRRRESLQAIARGVASLREVSGLEAGPQLRSVEARILADDPSMLVGSPAAPAPLRRLGLDIVGRRAERAAIRAAVRDVPGTGSRIVVVEGEPGIGKTMLCRFTAAGATDDGWHVASARCEDPGLAPSLWPVVRLVRALAEAVPDGGLGADLVLPGWIADGTTPLRPVAAAEVAHLMVRLVEAVTKPVLISVDDLHNADPGTLDVLPLFAGELGERPVLLLVAYRAGEVDDDALAAALGAFVRAAPLTRLTLSPLPADDVGRLVELTTGVAPDAAATARVAARTAGNPLFVTELARWEAEHGPDTTGVPPAIRDVVRQRLMRLPPGTVDELRTAAVVGESFDLATVLAATASARDDCLDALGAALDARILQPDGGGYRFSHAVVRDAVLADLNGVRLAREHDRAADALEQRFGCDHPDVVEPLATHRLAALPVGEPATAARAAIRAADVARWRGSLDRADDFANRALDALAGGPPAPDLEVEAMRALADQAIRRDGSRGLLAVAERLATRVTTDAAQALSLFLRWAPSDAADDLRRSDHLLDPARALAARSTDPYAVGTAHCVVGAHLALSGELADGLAHLHRAVAAVASAPDATPDPRLPMIAPVPAGLAAAMMGEADLAREHARTRTATWTAYRSGVDTTRDATLAFNRATVEALLGCPERVIAELGELALTDDDGFLDEMAASGEILLGWARARTGDHDGAIDAARALARLERSSELLLRTVLQTFCGEALLCADDPAAVEVLAAARSLAERRGERWWLAETLRLQALAAERFGRPGVAQLRAEARSAAERHGNRAVLGRLP